VRLSYAAVRVDHCRTLHWQPRAQHQLARRKVVRDEVVIIDRNWLPNAAIPAVQFLADDVLSVFQVGTAELLSVVATGLRLARASRRR